MKSASEYNTNLAELTQGLLLDEYAPASVLINRNYDVLYCHGPTDDFLQPASGKTTRDLIAMVRQDLQISLRAACHTAVRENQTVRDNTSRFKQSDIWHTCTITVKPISEPKQADGLLLVTFQKDVVKPLSDDAEINRAQHVEKLPDELKATREELQSLNEELNAVNSQLQDKLEELDKTHNDMSNLLNSAGIATLFLDTQLCIRQFTPATGELLGLITGDAGRPINAFTADLIDDSMITEAHRVLDNPTPIESLLTTSDDRHYLRRILPYRTADNHIDGLVVTFMDVTQRIESDAEMRRMATILHDSNDAITLLDLEGRVTAWNKGAERMYGYSEAEALKLHITDLLPAEKIPLVPDGLKKIARGEQIQSRNTVRLTKDGRALDVWIVFTILTNERGEPIGLATTEHDLSERIQLEALRAETERLVRMVDHLPVGAVYRINDNLIMNRACEKITGYQRDELDTLDQWFEKLHGEQASEYRHLYEHNRDNNFLSLTEPVTITRKDGNKRYVEFAGYRFDDQDVWIMHDVTERQAAEATLRDREYRLRAVMDNAAEAIIAITTHGVITDFNNAAESLFGYTHSEAVGHNFSMLLPSPHRKEHDKYMADYRRTGESRILNQPRQVPGRHKNGTIIPLEIKIAQADHLGVFVGIIRDLSEQKTLERQIAEVSNREQERIGQEIHDSLGQQLTGLSLIAASVKHSLARQNLPEAQQLDGLILQLQHAIKDARALSHGLSPVPVTPEGLQDALTLLAHDINSTRGIDCRFESRDSVDIEDRTTAMQIYRIAQEAVNNAVKYAHADSIQIVLANTAMGCELSVHDNGRGFDVSHAMNDGLGLRIMRYRAGIIGCTLEVKSSAEKGTIVHCRRTMANPER